MKDIVTLRANLPQSALHVVPSGKDAGPATIRRPLFLAEHHLKMGLVEKWSTWIVENMNGIWVDARNDCYEFIDWTSEKAKWEVTKLDVQLACEWTRREWLLVMSLSKLEGILHRRMEECINIVKEQQLEEWMQSEFAVGQRKRLEKEREQVKERMEKKMKDSAKLAEEKGRAWRDQQGFSPR